MPRLFRLVRDTDHTGISGTGHIADGVQFDDGHVVLRWLGPNASTSVWDNLDRALNIHGHGGATRVAWADTPEQEEPTP